uniref:Poly [ADP-ribose] polymerase n=1 Tax=Poecilia reticulata TaxID=8081 RepID=A0A3P9N3P1_POERE
MWALNEEEKMDTSDTPWYWYYLEDCGRWHRVEVNLYLFLRFVSFCGGGRKKNSSRYCMCVCVCVCVFKLIRLSELTSEYKTVADYVSHDGLLSKSIVSISRIQNLELWEIYCRKKRQLMKIKHVQDIPERRLFHGTDTKNVDSICKYNFDLRIPKKNGRTFGNGIYFAIHASFADKYSTNSTLHGNTKSIFLARVMVGKCNLGKPDLLKPDDENAFDSCVNDANNPTIFIIFDPNQVYPEYLIEYQ